VPPRQESDQTSAEALVTAARPWPVTGQAGGGVGGGDVAGDGFGARPGVALEGADGGVPGPGEQGGRVGAVLGTGSKRFTNRVEYLSLASGPMGDFILVDALCRCLGCIMPSRDATESDVTS
jgi:hypothetical protein